MSREASSRRPTLRTEIRRLELELSQAAWEEYSHDQNLRASSERLGVTERYLLRLLGCQIVNVFRSGGTYDDLAISLVPFELECWTYAVEQLEENEVLAANRFRASWYGKGCLEVLDGGGTLEEIAEYEKISLTHVRAAAALAAAERGETLELIGRRLGVTRERVRQILADNWEVTTRQLSQTRTTQAEASQQELCGAIEAWVRRHPGCTSEELETALGVEATKVLASTSLGVRHLVLDLNQLNNTWTISRWNREQTYDALQKAFEIRNPLRSMLAHSTALPLSGSYYERLRRSGQVDGPSESRILQVYGTWSEACIEAGVPANEALREDYGRRWSDEELVGYVATFLTSASTASAGRFDFWCREDETRPSFGTVRNQLRLSWSAAKESALQSLRSQWIAPLLSGAAHSTTDSPDINY